MSGTAAANHVAVRLSSGGAGAGLCQALHALASRVAPMAAAGRPGQAARVRALNVHVNRRPADAGRPRRPCSRSSTAAVPACTLLWRTLRAGGCEQSCCPAYSWNLPGANTHATTTTIQPICLFNTCRRPGPPPHPVRAWRMLQAAKRQAEARGERVQMVDTDWRWWPRRFVDDNPFRVGLFWPPTAGCQPPFGVGSPCAGCGHSPALLCPAGTRGHSQQQVGERTAQLGGWPPGACRT